MTLSPDLVVDFDRSPSRLTVHFPYDERALALIKAVPGRQYNKEGRFWRIPATGLRTLQAQAARRGFNVVVLEKVARAQARGQEDKGQLKLLKMLDDAPLDLPTETDARPYQRAGIRYLQLALRKFKGVLLADDMGLGKTFQALSVIALSKLRTVLVLAPATVKWVWADEIETHYPDMSYVVIDGDAEQRRLQWAQEARVKIVNYELLIPLRRQDEGGDWHVIPTPETAVLLDEWDMVVSDECAKLKNYKTLTAQTVKGLSRRYSLGLSGAPIENRLEELHSIMDFAMPGLLGAGWLFFQEHCVTDPRIPGRVIGYRGIDQVRERIAPHYLRRIKDDVLTELPPKTFSNVMLEMSTDEWTVYDAIRKQIKEAVRANPKLRVANILTEILRLKQCTNDTRLLGEEGVSSTKLEALRDLLEASEGHKVVAFTQFAEFAKLIHEELGGLLLVGETELTRRRHLISRFQGGDDQLFISTEAGAYGITLTAADIVVHLDQPWNPARLRQREDRLHRLGQTKNVQVVTFICKRTVDEYVRSIIHRKRALAAAVFPEEKEVDEIEDANVTKADVLALLGGD